MPSIYTVMKLSKLLRRTHRRLAVPLPPSPHLALGAVPQYHSAILVLHLPRALEAPVLCAQEVCLCPKVAVPLLPDHICRALLQGQVLVPAAPLRQWAWALPVVLQDLVGLRARGMVPQEGLPPLPQDVGSRRVPQGLPAPVSRG